MRHQLCITPRSLSAFCTPPTGAGYRAIRPRDSRLEGVYTHSGIQRYDQPARRLGRGVAADYVVQRPARLQGVYEGSVRKACSTCDVYAGHEGVDEAAQAGGFFAEAFTGDADAADAASGGRGQHERGASVRLPTRSPVHVDVHGRYAGAKIRLYARLCSTPSARPMCAARSGGPTQRSLGVYV